MCINYFQSRAETIELINGGVIKSDRNLPGKLNGRKHFFCAQYNALRSTLEEFLLLDWNLKEDMLGNANHSPKYYI